MVSSNKPKVGGEVVSYCTKCRLDLDHRVIAMVGSTPVKVECRTCGSHHKYRKPASEREREQKAASVSSSPSTKSRSGVSTPRSASARALAEAEADNDRERGWQAKIAGQGSAAFAVYSPKRVFGSGELMRHPKFGDGYVLRVVDATKVEVMFKDGARLLAHGLA
jgi:hypothetical protein